MVEIPSSDQINSLLSKFANDEQDPAIVEQVHSRASEILTDGEEIAYIAVQKKLVMNVAPMSVVLTNKRFIIFKPKMMGGINFDDYLWRDLHEAHMREGLRSSTITINVGDHDRSVDNLPKTQARKIYTFAQSMEEKMKEERRQRELEEKRASSGGIIMNTAIPITPQPAQKDDPLETLKKLKNMLDAGLITEEEYNTKKAQILSNM